MSAMAKMRQKADLPAKDCVTCGRPFTWRKKLSSAECESFQREIARNLELDAPYR